MRWYYFLAVPLLYILIRYLLTMKKRSSAKVDQGVATSATPDNVWGKLLYFQPWEFDSPDVLGSHSNMQPDFLLLLDAARGYLGAPMRINSGYRTLSHNARVGGVADSSHMKGYAADIHAPDGLQQDAIVEALRYAGFLRIGRYNTFVHVDSDPLKPYQSGWDKRTA